MSQAFHIVTRTLLRESLAPPPLGALVDAALDALARLGVAAPGSRAELGADAAVAERLLGECVASLPDAMPVLRAMARAAADPHTLLVSTRAGAGMMSLISGGAASDPGLTFTRAADGGLLVAEVVANGPAAAAGIQPGDRIVRVADEAVSGGMDFVASVLAAGEGQTVPVELERAGERRRAGLVSVTGELPVASSALRDGHGHIRLRWITLSKSPDRDVATLLARALDELAAAGARSILLDLRGNQGGYGVTRVASVVTDGDPIAIYRGADGTEDVGARVGERSSVRLPIAVLVDGETNSSAELVALALQQHGSARIFGRPSAGGLNVPKQVPLGDGAHILMVPGLRALGPRTRAPVEGMRVTPDVILPPHDAASLAAGRDEQLDAVCRAMA